MDHRELTEEDYKQIVRDIVKIIKAYDGGDALFSCQGQAMSGYAALAEFVSIARKARELLEENQS
jgi:hypothetical protein